MESNKLVVVTGAGKGFSVGGGGVNGLLTSTDTNVISVGRSPAEMRAGHNDLTPEQQGRLHHLQIDLSTPEGVAQLAVELADFLNQTKLQLCGVIASLGTGNVDYDLAENPSLRAHQRFLNVEGPNLLAKELMDRRLLTHEAVFAYISALFTAPALQGMLDGVVDEFTKDKLDGSAQLKRLFAEPGSPAYTKVIMGEVKGDMMNKYMTGSESGGLVPHAVPAWFMGLPAAPNRKGGIGEQLAKLVVNGPLKAPAIAKIPRLSGLLYHVPPRLLKFLFPKILKSGAPAVAEYYEVKKDDFDECIEWHMEQGTHPGIDLRAAASQNWGKLSNSKKVVNFMDQHFNV